MSAPASTNGLKRLTVILTMAATVMASLVASLQADASIHTDVANRESQYYAILASGELYRQGLASDHDLETLASVMASLQEATLLQFTALEQESRSEIEAAVASLGRASLAEARAARLGELSVLLSDPAYAPASEVDPPALQAYLDDSFEEANRLVELQNDAADAYDAWNQKSDAYVTVLALMAIVLFLYGLAQASDSPARRAFLAMGAAVQVLGLIWTVMILSW